MKIIPIGAWCGIIIGAMIVIGLLCRCAPTYHIPADQYLYVGGLPAAVKNIQETKGHDTCMVVGFNRKGEAIVKCPKVRER